MTVLQRRRAVVSKAASSSCSPHFSIRAPYCPSAVARHLTKKRQPKTPFIPQQLLLGRGSQQRGERHLRCTQFQAEGRFPCRQRWVKPAKRRSLIFVLKLQKPTGDVMLCIHHPGGNMHSRREFLSASVALAAVAFLPSAHAQAGGRPMVAYDDELKNGWQNWSWAKVAMSVPAGGSKPI